MFKDIRRLIPHRPPFLLVDELSSCGEHQARATRVFAEGDYGCDNGMVTEVLLIECLAQTAAAFMGHRAYGQGQDQAQGQAQMSGLLVGVEDFSLRSVAHCGEVLALTVSVVRTFGAFVWFDGRVERAGEVVATCILKVYLDGAANS